MFRNRRSFAWSLVLALLCASFVVAQPPITDAAGPFVVTKTADTNDGVCGADCSLREAISSANAAGGNSTINFQGLSTVGEPGFDGINWTITPLSPLPSLTASGITILGRLDPFSGVPRVVIDGSGLSSAVGLRVNSSNNIIKQLIIINFSTSSSATGIGIRIFGPNGANAVTTNTVVGCYIGSKPGDSIRHPNQRAGIQIDNSTGNTIGGSSFTDRNIISGNDGSGIVLNIANNNTLLNNYIGLTLNGGPPTALNNAGNGIELNDSSDNTVGGTTFGTPAPSNYIGANTQNGILLAGTNTKSNTIAGNYIGNDGTNDFGNGKSGIRIESGAVNNIVSGNTLVPTIISGNGEYGILIRDNGTDGNQVSGAYIGLQANGAIALPNDSGGIHIAEDASNNLIGISGEGNTISGNTGYGVSIGRTALGITDIFSNTITANFIGLNSAGTTAVPNTLGGVLIDNGTKNNRLGGSSAAERNVISGNGGPGVVISGTATVSNTVSGNVIGLRSASVGAPLTSAGANTGDGVLITGGATGSRIGGTAAEANTIGANIGNGVRVSGSGTDNTIIQSNLIGTSFTNNIYVALGNTQNGVQVDGQAFNTAITSSKIYSNTLNGVLVSGTGTQRVKMLDNSMQGNLTGGIDLTPDTTSPPAGPLVGSATNPNHDIDPPYSLHIDQTGKLSGKIRLLPNNPAISACAQPCAIQIFTTNPQTLDTQGRDKLNAAVPIVPDSTDPSFGNFSVAIGSVPPQLALTATDKDGNTSEFAVITSAFSLDIQPPRFTNPAYPGQVITYTHRISNTGTVDFTNIQFTAFSKLGWSYKLAPTSPITLLAGEGKPVTLTLTLPTGSAPNVRAGLIELTRLTVSATTTNPAMVTTASVTDTTTVGGKFILDASFKLGRTGSGAPGTVIDYTRNLTNTGNVSGTVTLSATTDLGWTTLVTPTSVILQPGQAIGVDSSVAIPQGATAGTVAKTPLTLDGSQVGQPLVDTQQLVITDTTTTLLTPKATMVFAQEKSGGAGQPVDFCHTVTNLSNGPATFTLTGVSSQGSKITFVSDTPGRPLVNGTTFTVGITDADKSFSFCANVVIYIGALKGQQDFISIGLIDDQGGVVGGASVRDLINVIRSAVIPHVYMPAIRR